MKKYIIILLLLSTFIGIGAAWTVSSINSTKEIEVSSKIDDSWLNQ